SPETTEQGGRAYVAPRNATQETLCRVFAEVLAADRVGIDDNFFELGGDSIICVRAAGLAKQRGVELTLLMIYKRPTVRLICEALAEQPEKKKVASARSGPLAAQRFALIGEADARLVGEEIEDAYPLTELQLGMIYHSYAGDDAYHIVDSMTLTCAFDEEALRLALRRAMDNHPVLRTAFDLGAFSEPLQLVRRSVEPPLIVTDVRSLSDEARAACIDEFLRAEHEAHFDLAQAPLFRVVIHRLTDDSLQFTFSHHHAILDGWSVNLFCVELIGDYVSRLRHGRAAQPGLVDRAMQELVRLELDAKRSDDIEDYWRARIDRLEPQGGTTNAFRARQTQETADEPLVCERTLPRDLQQRLTALAAGVGAPLKTVLLAAHLVALGRVFGRTEVTTGITCALRPEEISADRALGLFLSTLPLNLSLQGGSWRELILEAFRVEGELLERRFYPLSALQRLAGNRPLFDVNFYFLHFHVSRDVARMADVGILASRQDRAAFFGLNVDFYQDPDTDELRFSVVADPKIFDAVLPKTFSDVATRALEAMAADADQRYEALDVLSADERRRVLLEWNATAGGRPAPACLHELFEAQAALSPAAVAVAHEHETLSYGELNARANRLARHLRKRGVGPDVLVGLCVEPSLDMVVGMLGVLKAGGAYLPLDPNYPRERLAYMIADARPRLVLAQARFVKAPPSDVETLDLDDDGEVIARESADNLAPRARPQNLAYVIYTSGSTGKPKGVLTPHSAIGRLILDNGYAAFCSEDRIACVSNPAFDAMTMEVWAAFAVGARTVVIDRDTLLDPPRFADALERQGVTALFLTTGLFNQLAAAIPMALARLRFLLTGGEACNTASFRAVLAQGGRVRLIHCYGPTETTTYATTFGVASVEAGARDLPIGRPIACTQTYILDAYMNPAPIGAAGELFIGGEGVARGYLNRPDLAAERFVPNPFGAPGERLYRTGDLALYDAQGDVVFVGRVDRQVKIRGFRVEAGEVEATLLGLPDVREAVVIAQEERSSVKRLLAYVVARGGVETSAAALRAALSQELPDYMIPAAIMLLDALPLNPNGKIDRKALPEPDMETLAADIYVAPRDATEQQMCRVWAEALGVERVGVEDDFFRLGGHSLVAVTLIERLRKEGFAVDVRALFAHPTPAGLASVVGVDGSVAAPPNLILQGCAAITPEMVTLAQLTQAEIDRIVANVAGGAANVQDIYPLAPLQEGMLFHHLLSERGDPYLLESVLSFVSRERLEDFLAALRTVIARHDILRTAIAWEGLSEPMQVVWREAPLVVEEVVGEAGDAVAGLRDRFGSRSHRLDIRQAPLLRGFYCRDADRDRWLLLLLTHHLVMDHAALEVVVEGAQAHLAGEAASMRAPVPFRNFVAQARLGVTREEHEAFFREMLADVEEPTAPFGAADVFGDGSKIREARFSLAPELSARIRARARDLGVSAASLTHQAFALVLARVCGRSDVVFGTVLLGRMQGGAGADRAVGVFINTLPVRARLGTLTVAEAVVEMHASLTRLLRHEHASLALAQRCSRVEAPAPLFTALLNYRHNADESQSSSAARSAWSGIETLFDEERTNYPLILSVEDAGAGFGLTAQTAASIDPERLCAFMAEALEGLVEALGTSPDKAARLIGILPQAERRRLLVAWNDTAAEYPREERLHGAFEAQAARAPQAIAVSFAEQALSYGELDASANQLAHRLRAQGVGPDVIVGLCLERSLEMVVAIFGVLKAGGAYLPLDPENPPERLAYMIADARPRLVLTQARFADRLPDDAQTLQLDADWGEIARESAEKPAERALPLTLAYVIYTSGSTGRPKGVGVSHDGIVNRISWMQARYGLTPADAVLQKTPFGFDVSVWEFFWPLSIGARLVVAQPGDHRLPDRLAALIERDGVTTLHFVPSMLQAFLSGYALASFNSLRRVICSGEALPASLARACDGASGLTLHNLYGPTEASVDVTAYACGADEAEGFAPIGRPIWNTQIYLLDPDMQPVPQGVAGELYIGGVGLARGYVGRPDLTAERFVPNPFGKSGSRLYRTGDLARYRADGNIEFLGRLDHQVKIRGFRIELGEIEAALARRPEIRDAVVLAREDEQADRRLVAYVTARAGAMADAAALRSALALELPDYMVPSAFVEMDALPLTQSGKVDRKALPAPAATGIAARRYVAPRDAAEETICRVWAETLGVERVGIDDNFFELGGHSLRAIALVERLRQAGVASDVRRLFAHPTPAGIRESMGGARRVEIPPNLIPQGCAAITPEMVTLAQLSQAEIDRIVALVPGGAANVQDIYALAPLQEGMLFHHLLSARGDPYLLESVVALPTRQRLEAFLAALQRVVARHDVLRTAIAWEGLTEPVQVVWRDAPLVVEEVAIDPQEEALETLRARFNPATWRLDVRRAPLARAHVAFDAGKERWLLQILAHHLSVDHATFEIVLRETAAVLSGESEPTVAPPPFRNFVAQARLSTNRAEQEAYFRAQLGDIDEPTAPFGLLDVQGDGSGVREASRELDANLSARLLTRARALGVSAASLFHTAFGLVVGRACGRDDVVFGTVLFGRMQGLSEADRAVGMFINTLPLRLRLGDSGVEAGVRETHALLTELLAHEHASLALAQRCSGVEAPAPLFSALLNYRHAAVADAGAAPASSGVEMIYAQERTNYPLTLSVNDLGDGFSLDAQTQSPLAPERLNAFMEVTVERLVTALEEAPRTPLRGIDAMPPSERRQQLVAWNETAHGYARAARAHELFEAQAARAPLAAAVVDQGRSLSYGELNARANRLAHALQRRGVGPDVLVGLCVERSLEMVVGLLAILKAGGAYLPLDPDYPQERLAFMIADAKPRLVLTQARRAAALASDVEILRLDADWAEIARESAENLVSRALPQHLAYVIYTSGSTGRPKGVMIAHESLMNYLSASASAYPVAQGEVAPVQSSIAFDATITSLFLPLCCGRKLFLCPQGAETQSLVELLRSDAALSLVKITPAHLGVLNSLLRPADFERAPFALIIGGEALGLDVARPWIEWAPHCRIINEYGPTETVVGCCIQRVDASMRPQSDGSAPIGRPIWNTQLYILDAEMSPAPIGVAGELYIGGAGLARGYLGRPDLTAERFVPNPYGAAGARLYRTGDLARYRADGVIEFLGRVDQQVKIRGFRIELGEIEAALLRLPEVREAVVVARPEGPAGKRLIAYVTGAGAEPAALRAALARELPDYMVPSAVLILETLPLTQNGKV
ncbi:MAG TPA: amino acid adenylation domain-containing protein, partial [Methylocystis sp.]|nr:amino acid adenylation domain-containing protein [Methylocystis sp.]